MQDDKSDILHLRIDPAAGAPIYLQIIEQIRYGMATGALRPHDELPSVRALASRYLINPNTVVRAYLELEREELIYKKRGMGTYVAEKSVSMSDEQKLEIVRDLIDRALVQGVQLGLGAEELKRAFSERLDFFTKQEDNEDTDG